MSHANSRIVLGESSRCPIQVGSSCPFLKKMVWVVGGSEPELYGLVFSRPDWPCMLSSWSRLDGYATEPAVRLCSLLHDSRRGGTGADRLYMNWLYSSHWGQEEGQARRFWASAPPPCPRGASSPYLCWPVPAATVIWKICDPAT